MRANNLLQFIHQITIEFRFWNSLTQERFKSNLEFRYQFIVSFIRLRKCFAKFMIPIALLRSFWVNKSATWLVALAKSNYRKVEERENDILNVFLSRFNWQRPDCGQLLGTIAEMLSKCCNQPHVTVLAGQDISTIQHWLLASFWTDYENNNCIWIIYEIEDKRLEASDLV